MSFQNISTSFLIVYRSPTTPAMPKHHWFRLIPVRSPLLRESLLFSFPPGNEMFQFPGFAFRFLGIPDRSGGLPHSEICGLAVICTSPQLIAAYHVLLRLKEPRHPPYALIYFLSPFGTNIAANAGFLLYAFLLKLCFFQHVNELYPCYRIVWFGEESNLASSFNLQANLFFQSRIINYELRPLGK